MSLNKYLVYINDEYGCSISTEDSLIKYQEFESACKVYHQEPIDRNMEKASKAYSEYVRLISYDA